MIWCLPDLMMWLTWLTSTVMPRSLNDPVWLTPHCLTHSSGMPSSRPKRSAQKRLVPPSSRLTMSASGMPGSTISFLPQTPEENGHWVRL